MSTKAYRDGWERTFRSKPTIHVCPFNMRRGLVINVELPDDLKLRDLRRFVQYLATMCDDWEPEMGFPVLAWPEFVAAEAGDGDSRVLARLGIPDPRRYP
jgi:hypothetical protein